MPPKGNTKRKILDVTEALIQDLGYNGFSYAHIASNLGVKNAAIHYHFPTKEELVGIVLHRYRDRFELWINNARVKDLSHAEKLDWFFEIYINFRAEGKVCLTGTLESDFNTVPQSVREETQGLNQDLLAWLAEMLEAGRAATVFDFKGTAADKAMVILASLQGALQMARALGTEKFLAVVRQHKQDILA